MKSVALTAFARELRKRLGSKKVRNNGRIPAVVYGGRGGQEKGQNVEVAEVDLKNAIQNAHSEILLVDLSVSGNGGSRLALVKEIQHHPLSGKILHVDFQEVAENQKVTVSIPVETSGEPVGVKVNRGTLEHVLFNVKVRATPRDLPDVIMIDVTNLDVGSTIHIGEIQPPQGVEILGNKEIPVVTVAAPLVETAEEAAPEAGAGAAPTQPEMLKEKKEEPAAAGGDKKAPEKKK